MKSPIVLLSIGLLSAMATGAAMAQAPNAKADQPTAIGVSQETANSADAKARSNGTVGTVVRTGPTAAEKAGDVAAKTKDKANAVTSKTKKKVNDATSSTKDATGDTTSDVKSRSSTKTTTSP